MKPRPKVVFDTNIFISAILFGGNPRVCLNLAREQSIGLFTSKSILLEFSQKLNQKFKWNEQEVREVLEGIKKFAIVVSPKKKMNLIKNDPPDNRILECASHTKADYIISGDKKHILPLKKFGSIRIVSAKEFLDEYYSKQ